ncbi:MAG: helix-turn-helix domain-containing protein [Caloramator sp.]|nr:helix-turn-helix domain-containing protein [Caloramator sp.]
MTKLREAREKTGLRRNFVAKELKITGDHLNLIERGKVDLKLSKIATLANLYNLSFEEMAKIAFETWKEGK